MRNGQIPAWLLFSGGCGNTTLLEAMRPKTNQDVFKLSVIINGLDDGSSTGEIRRLLDYRCHGISDFLKVIVTLAEDKILADSLNCRCPKEKTLKDRLKLYHDLYLFIEQNAIPKYFSPFSLLPPESLSQIKTHLCSFLEYCYTNRDKLIDIDDFKVGNIVFASMLIKNDMGFNRTLVSFSDFCSLPERKINILANSDEVRYLTGVLKNGCLLPNEAAVVRTRTTDFIKEIFQLPMPLSMNQIRKICSSELNEKIAMLNLLADLPRISESAENAIMKSDLIIYGLGTPYSSILPSIATRGMAKTISATNCPKVLIANLKKESSNSMATSHLIGDMLKYLSLSVGETAIEVMPEQLITHIIVPLDTDGNDTSIVNVDDENIARLFPWLKIIKDDIIAKDSKYVHDGQKLLGTLLSVA